MPGFLLRRLRGAPDGFIASRSTKLVKVGKTFVINGTVYLRTKVGLVAQ